MKQEIGWGAAIAVAVAAAVGVTSQFSGKPATDQEVTQQTTRHAAQTTTTEESDFSRGPCVEIENHLKSFLGVSASAGIAAPDTCFKHRDDQPAKNPAGAENKNAAAQQRGKEGEELRSGSTNLQFMIATLPDPSHSHFALQFDRQAEAIQQGASDESYVYDSSWFPWETRPGSYSSLADQDKADARKEAQEEQPGILLFRRSLRRAETEKCASGVCPPYSEGLVVFVVGEEPTNGIHRAQFRNAAAWIAALHEAGGPDHLLPPRILGPSFSGSAPSLANLILEIHSEAQAGSLSLPAPDKEKMRVYSGNMSGQTALEWFQRKAGSVADFASFQRSDDYLLSRYCEFLNRLNFDLYHLAILSEDQTAYGAEAVQPPQTGEATRLKPDDAVAGCNLRGTGSARPKTMRPLRLFYPRDISELRAAYQKQSIFSSRAAPQTDVSQRTLAPDIADPEGKQHDVIRTYSGDQKTLSQEAVMQQIVSELRVHQSEYIVLRSSNPMDQIFLSHYLRLSYPQGRIVILGADQLLRRETGAARLSGIMTLTTYPLLPWEPHWTQETNQPYGHSHRVFAQDGAEGAYVATRALLHFPIVIGPQQSCEDAVGHLLAANYKSTRPGVDIHSNLSELCKVADGHLDFVSSSEDHSSSMVTLEIERGAAPADAKIKAIRKIVGDQIETLQRLPLPIPALSGFTPTDPELKIPDYGAPFWVEDSSACEDRPDAPPAWLSVLGRNDFWPVAALNCKSIQQESLRVERETSFFHDLMRATGSLVRVFAQRGYPDRDRNADRWYELTFTMRAALAALFFWAAFHLCCCLFPSVTTKPRHRTYFVYFEENRRPYLGLLVMASITISATATVIAGGLGAMSSDGMPITNPMIWGWVIPGTWLIAFFSLVFNLWQQIPGETGKVDSSTGLLVRIRRNLSARGKKIWQSLAWFMAGSLFVYVVFYLHTESAQVVATRIPTYWRSMHLTNGVSPVIPLLALCAGIYLWIWFSLQGLALLGQDRPYLPPEDSLQIPVPHGVPVENRKDWLKMFSQQYAGDPVEDWCGPFARVPLITAILLFLILGALTIFLVAWEEAPLRSLGVHAFALMMCLVLGGLISVMLANAWQLLHIWMELRRLLIHLDRLPLRRSFAAFQGISWGSVWTVSGNVFDMRYKLLTHETRCITHLKSSLAEDSRSHWLFGLQGPQEQWVLPIEQIDKARMQFADWYSRVYDQPNNRDQEELRTFQKALADFAGLLIAQMLVPEWRQERGERLDTDQAAEETHKPGTGPEELTPVSKLQPHIRHAEAFVCFVFRGYIQNIMGRMRSLVMGMLWLYIATTFAMASYPFDPRPAISGVMLLLFGALGTSVVYVYAQMHRDPILSLMTNTTPGELGTEFWLKVIGFGAGPVLGLMTTLFPQLTDFVFSWVQPGISSTK